MDYLNKERPFYAVNDFYQIKFNSKVFRISLNGDFTCPNRDGSLSYDGCIYCSEKGSGDFAGDKSKPLISQFIEVKNALNKKWPIGKTIAYFQANTNTYAPLSKLKSLYEEALNLDESIVGLSIATRADCLSDEIIDYLADLSKRTFLTVEIGLQTIHEVTSLLINRGHDLQTFIDAVHRLRKHNIHVVVHIINGLPYETFEMMMQTLLFVNTLDIQGIKIHMLYILKKTALEVLYQEKGFHILSLEEYVQITSSQIENLRKDIVIYRLTGDAPKDMLIEPLWSLKKFVVTNEIDKLLRKNKTYQGILYNP